MYPSDNIVATFDFVDHKGNSGTGRVVKDQFAPSNERPYIPESNTLGMGHHYGNAHTAAYDLVRRHGGDIVRYTEV